MMNNKGASLMELLVATALVGTVISASTAVSKIAAGQITSMRSRDNVEQAVDLMRSRLQFGDVCTDSFGGGRVSIANFDSNNAEDADEVTMMLPSISQPSTLIEVGADTDLPELGLTVTSLDLRNPVGLNIYTRADGVEMQDYIANLYVTLEKMGARDGRAAVTGGASFHRYVGPVLFSAARTGPDADRITSCQGTVAADFRGICNQWGCEWVEDATPECQCEYGLKHACATYPEGVPVAVNPEDPASRAMIQCVPFGGQCGPQEYVKAAGPGSVECAPLAIPPQWEVTGWSNDCPTEPPPVVTPPPSGSCPAYWSADISGGINDSLPPLPPPYLNDGDLISSPDFTAIHTSCLGTPSYGEHGTLPDGTSPACFFAAASMAPGDPSAYCNAGVSPDNVPRFMGETITGTCGCQWARCNGTPLGTPSPNGPYYWAVRWACSMQPPVNAFSPGSHCGAYLDAAFNPIQQVSCQGHNPNVSCPAGFNRVAFYFEDGHSGRYATCVEASGAAPKASGSYVCGYRTDLGHASSVPLGVSVTSCGGQNPAGACPAGYTRIANWYFEDGHAGAQGVCVGPDDPAAVFEEGEHCGQYVDSATIGTHVVTCQGHNPNVSCPAGFRRFRWTFEDGHVGVRAMCVKDASVVGGTCECEVMASMAMCMPLGPGSGGTFTSTNVDCAAMNTACMPDSGGGGGGTDGMMCNFTPSDARLKRDIVYIGQVNGFNVYEYSYVDGVPGYPSQNRYIGVMAQEVMRTRPDAITVRPDGYMAVNYELIGVNFRQVR